MNEYIRLLLAILTCYRLARMVALDDGPFFVFKRIRYWAKDRAYYEAWAEGETKPTDEVSDRHFGKWHNLAEGISCPFCVGTWLSLPLFLLVVKPRKRGDMFLLLIAISGGQAFLQTLDKD